MSTPESEPHGCDQSRHGFAVLPQNTTTTLALACRSRKGHGPRALIVEFRDEVYTSLKACFEEGGFEVERAKLGAMVASAVHRFVPDLVLVSDAMPDEDAWLITAKLQFSPHRQFAWVYATRSQRCSVAWKQVCAVDEVIEYGGNPTRLVRQIQKHINEWFVNPRVKRKRA